MEREFGTDSLWDIRASGIFAKRMSHLCGETATIGKMDRDRVYLQDRSEDARDLCRIYTTDMIEHIDEGKKEKRVLSDELFDIPPTFTLSGDF